MRKIGLIGGVGPQATAFIYKQVLAAAQTNYGATDNDDYPDMIIASLPVPDFISSKDNLQHAKTMLIEAARGLENAGCEALCIGSNTVHILLEEMQTAVSIPFISMVDLVAVRCHELSYSTVALLGTPTLLDSGLYDRALGTYGIDLLKPSNDQIGVSDTVIRSVISGANEIPMRQEYVDVLSDMFDRGADAIILGCTELPLVMDYEVLGRRILSSDVILAHGIAKFCYGD